MRATNPWEGTALMQALDRFGGTMNMSADGATIDTTSAAIVEGFTDAVFVADSAWELAYANAQAAALLGRPREELLGRSLWQTFPDELGSACTGQYHQARERGTPVNLQVFCPSLERWLEVRIYPAPPGLTVCLSDISARKALERALHESEARQHELVVATSRQSREIALLDRLRTDLTHQLDERMIIRTVVAIIADQLGYPQLSIGLCRGAEFVGEAHVGLAHRPIRLPLASGMMGRIARTKRAELVPDVTHDPDFIGDADATGAAICVPLLDDEELLGVINVEGGDKVALDDNDLRLLTTLAQQVGVALGRARRHEALRWNEARLRTQYQALPLPTYTWEHRNGDFLLLDYNAAAERIARGTLQEKLGQAASDIYAHVPDVCEYLTRCYTEKRTLQHELRYHAPLSGKDLDLIATYLYVAPDLVVMHSEDITARKAAEAALRASEARHRALVQHAGDVALIIGTDGRLRYISPASERVLGYRAADHIGEDGLLWVHPDEHALAEQTLAKVLAAPNATAHMEVRVRHRDGAWRWVEASITNLLTDPDIDGVVVNYRDISERRTAEAELRERDERFRLVARATNDTIWDWNLTSDALWWNEGIQTCFGYAPDQVGADIHWWESHIHPDDRGRVVEDIHAAIDGDAATWSAEYRFRCANGTYAPVLDRGFIVRDEQDGLVRMLGSMLDLTARKAAEEALRASEANLAAAQALAHLGSWEHDHLSGELRWSDECFRISGYPPQSFVPTPERMLAIVHPDDRALVQAALDASLDRGESYDLDHRLLRPDGEVRIVHQQAEVLHDSAGRPIQRRGIMQDVTERRALEAQLSHQALHDPLTGLPNRALFLDRLGHALDRARRDAQPCAVLLLDMDRFKTVNDSLGHGVGDRLLVAVAARLRTCLRDADTLARLGGDEFAILLEGIADLGEASRSAERLHAALQAPLWVEGREIYAPMSIGIALRSGLDDISADLLRFADVALYRAKEGGGGTSAIFYPGMSVQALEQLDLERDLRQAIEREELRVYYQPIVSLATGQITRLEALLRWQHPTRGLVPPNAFIPLAEKTGLIVPIGRWVLAAACRQLRAWQVAHPAVAAPLLSVNLSARQFRHPDLLADVAATLAETGLAPRQLVLEVTETVAMDGAETAIGTLEALHRMGVSLAIDDFGTGYSSLSYLQRLPVDTLKIDRAFFREQQQNRAIVRAVATLAHGLGLAVIAEGLETTDQIAWARAAGCDGVQGFYFAPPLPHVVIETLWQSGLVFSVPDQQASDGAPAPSPPIPMPATY